MPFVRLQGYTRYVYMVKLKLDKPLQFTLESPLDSVRSSSEHSGKGLKSNLASKGRKDALGDQNDKLLSAQFRCQVLYFDIFEIFASGSSDIPVISFH